MLIFNQALFGKWLWRYVQESDGLWRKIIDYKYGMWKYMQNGWGKFLNFFSFKVENGSRISLWHAGVGTRLLKDAYCELYNIARDRNAMVVDYF